MVRLKMSNINEALRLCRVFHDMKAIELSKKLTITPGYLSEIENGNKSPNIELISKYATIFKTTPAKIFQFSESLQKNYLPLGIKSKLRAPMAKMIEAFGD